MDRPHPGQKAAVSGIRNSQCMQDFNGMCGWFIAATYQTAENSTNSRTTKLLTPDTPQGIVPPISARSKLAGENRKKLYNRRIT
jgi:hypothetical protein